MSGDLVTHVFVNAWEMSYNDWFSGSSPNLKNIEIQAPENADFTNLFYRFIGDHRGGSVDYYCGNCNADVTSQEQRDYCEACEHYFIYSLDISLRRFLRRGTSN